MLGLLYIVLLFRIEFNIFNKPGAWSLDIIYHMTLQFRKTTLGVNNVKNLP